MKHKFTLLLIGLLLFANIYWALAQSTNVPIFSAQQLIEKVNQGGQITHVPGYSASLLGLGKDDINGKCFAVPINQSTDGRTIIVVMVNGKNSLIINTVSHELSQALMFAINANGTIGRAVHVVKGIGATDFTDSSNAKQLVTAEEQFWSNWLTTRKN